MTEDQEAHRLVQECSVFVLEPYDMRLIFWGVAIGPLFLIGMGAAVAACLAYKWKRQFSTFLPFLSEYVHSLISALPLIAAVCIGLYFYLRFLNQKLQIVLTTNFLIGPQVIGNQALDMFRSKRIAIRRSDIDFTRQKVRARTTVYLFPSNQQQGIAIFRYSTPKNKIKAFEVALGYQLLAPIGSMKRQRVVNSY